MYKLDLLDHIEIINHIQLYSKVYKINSKKDWIQILCPYCDDGYRKEHLDHGHFYIARHLNFAQCFRCDTKVSIKKFLIDIKFNNISLLNTLFKNNFNITYGSEYKKGIINQLDTITEYNKLKKSNIQDYNIFINYIKLRLSDIDIKYFSIYPIYIQNKLAIAFANYHKEISTIRFIANNNIRYYKLQTSVNYFFQNPDNNYNNIVLCEGSIDLINLYKYSSLFDNKNTFYIAINGRSYVSNLLSLISEYYLIGNYIINIVFDKGIKKLELLKHQLRIKSNILNPNIILNFYSPAISKDVSEFNLIERV